MCNYISYIIKQNNYINFIKINILDNSGDKKVKKFIYF